MVTIKEIADRAGVSTTTVSNVIHGKNKRVSPEKIEEIQRLVDELGYVKPMGLNVLHKQKSHLVAVIINRHQIYDQSVLNDPFYSSIIGYVEEELHRNDYYMMFYSSDKPDDIFTMALTWNVDAVILVSMGIKDAVKIKNMINKPVLCIDPVDTPELKESQYFEVGCVGLDDDKGGYLMTKYLIEHRYENIYICTDRINMGVGIARLNGALRAQKEMKDTMNTQIFPVSAGISYKERKGFYEILCSRYPFSKKTALFCLSDRYAMEANVYMQEKGIHVPEEIGLVGFDGISYMARNSVPRLTTISQNVFEKAHLAVTEIINAVEDPEYRMKTHVLDVGLITRQSIVE